MRKFTNLILSSISLVVTATLLIVVIFAWYVTNHGATATGVQGTIVAKTSIIDSVNIYSFDSVSTNNTTSTYVISDELSNEMRYNPNFSTRPTAKLVEINFVSPSVNLDSLIASTSSVFFPGFTASSTTGYIDSDEDLSLSSVIKFTVVQNVVFSSGATTTSGTVSLTTPSSFLNYSYDDSTGVISSQQVSLINSSLHSINKIYILIDFYQDAFDKLFSNNIGNSIIDEAEQLEYLTDFKFQLLGSVVNS